MKLSLHEDLHTLLMSLDVEWADPRVGRYLVAALSRRAANAEAGRPDAPHHESMEWLGDRVLGGVVGAHLWRRFPFAEQGRLDLARDRLTSEGPLAAVARRFELQDSIHMGRGEALQGQVSGDKALSDHVEALVAAVFLAGGWPAATEFVMGLMGDALELDLPEAGERLTGTSGAQAMTALNAAVQRIWRASIPASGWEVARLGGPDNAPVHRATVTLPDGSTHEGQDVHGGKPEAKASAAKAALAYLSESYGVGGA